MPRTSKLRQVRPTALRLMLHDLPGSPEAAAAAAVPSGQQTQVTIVRGRHSVVDRAIMSEKSATLAAARAGFFRIMRQLPPGENSPLLARPGGRGSRQITFRQSRRRL